MPRTRLYRMFVNLVFLLLCGIGGPDHARAELHWRMEKRENLRVRLIALSESDPRSSFFSTHEVFVAAQQLSEDESRLVKLVYEFLPYQPRLSESDFDYSVVHALRATRDPSCDQTLAQMTTDERTRAQVALKYSADSPVLNTRRHHSALPCFSTSAEDYTKAIHRPAPPEEEY
ncbi:MAG TPA: hypothetical protein VK829_15630 [Terriglobales bacterium]|jgi:hypothetical protein|nr:hypothetical protein [Terriglobales bacterium]